MIRPIRIRDHAKFQGIYVVEFEDGSQRLATASLAPGVKVYDEMLIPFENKELRTWNPYRSKLAGAILKGIELNPIKPGTKVLYLGVASPTLLVLAVYCMVSNLPHV